MSELMLFVTWQGDLGRAGAWVTAGRLAAARSFWFGSARGRTFGVVALAISSGWSRLVTFGLGVEQSVPRIIWLAFWLLVWPHGLSKPKDRTE